MPNNLDTSTTDIKVNSTAISWRDALPINPAAEIMPRPTDDELRDLAADIKAHGIREAVVLFRDEDGKISLLDGISRLDAATLAGLPVVKDGKFNLDRIPHRFEQGNVNPVALVVSLNIYRRHLTAEQRRDIIAKLIKAKPEASNNAIAKQAKADDKTVGKVRRELERRSEIPNVSTRVDTKGRNQPAKRQRSKITTSGPYEVNRKTNGTTGNGVSNAAQSNTAVEAKPDAPDVTGKEHHVDRRAAGRAHQEAKEVVRGAPALPDDGSIPPFLRRDVQAPAARDRKSVV